MDRKIFTHWEAWHALRSKNDDSNKIKLACQRNVATSTTRRYVGNAPLIAHFSKMFDSGNLSGAPLPSPLRGRSGCLGSLMFQMVHVRTEAMVSQTAEGARSAPASGVARRYAATAAMTDAST
eukprot:6211922-Pleurochrysis_carterae.AAC.1